MLKDGVKPVFKVIQTKIERGRYSSIYQSDLDIADALNSFNEGHTSYSTPYNSKFIFVHKEKIGDYYFTNLPRKNVSAEFQAAGERAGVGNVSLLGRSSFCSREHHTFERYSLRFDSLRLSGSDAGNGGT